jgi:hypothetical protein
MDYVGAAINSGSLGIAYCPKSAAITVEMTRFSGSVTARWYDPTDGAFKGVNGSPFSNTGSQQFSTPGNNSAGSSDWVLLLETQADTSKRRR